jgi:hypothetical protein
LLLIPVFIDQWNTEIVVDTFNFNVKLWIEEHDAEMFMSSISVTAARYHRCSLAAARLGGTSGSPAVAQSPPP